MFMYNAGPPPYHWNQPPYPPPQDPLAAMDAQIRHMRKLKKAWQKEQDAAKKPPDKKKWNISTLEATTLCVMFAPFIGFITLTLQLATAHMMVGTLQTFLR